MWQDVKAKDDFKVFYFHSVSCIEQFSSNYKRAVIVLKMLFVAVDMLLRGGVDVHGLELGLGNVSPNAVKSSCALLLECSGSEERPVLGTTLVALCVFQVSLLIRRELTERAKDFSLILDDVAITELSFSREYTAAVEAKQVGEFHWCLKRVDCLCLFSELLNEEVEFGLVCHCCVTV